MLRERVVVGYDAISDLVDEWLCKFVAPSVSGVIILHHSILDGIAPYLIRVSNNNWGIIEIGRQLQLINAVFVMQFGCSFSFTLGPGQKCLSMWNDHDQRIAFLLYLGNIDAMKDNEPVATGTNTFFTWAGEYIVLYWFVSTFEVYLVGGWWRLAIHELDYLLQRMQRSATQCT